METYITNIAKAIKYKFKSYYVVWKLGKDWTEYYNTADSLNRTM